ncbi:ribosome maturation factor RimP [Geothermobacter ehrlichii]|uniref:Ribosome maturation factor RimP n=1 Tax=Geothermobacter ehrlichii TaxID=213224 RepID=A0A5D3WLW0_9BACT|nr:ribosome maturation factor RimP [Geothermobacter ehrlichii]TYO99712.1 ribosome maturation factor RimP [Geothermobacter ehrlichii]
MVQGTLIEERIVALISPIVEDFGLELVEVEYRREGSSWVLRIFIDKDGGVTLDDCADLSREIDPVIETEDIIPHAYRLEVSSPGLDRPLKKPADFIRFRDEWIKVKTYERLDPDGRGHERKTFVGILKEADEERFRIEFQDKRGGEAVFTYDQVAGANLDPQF